MTGMWWLWLAGVVVVVAEDSQPWWRDAVVYQIYPRSFKDSNGDGVGDLKGITQMASYLKDLGVDAVWLSPIYTSPMADFGYDISNYRDIDPIFGTLQDFDELVKKFKELDIKLLIDFVPNHTSDQHPWFQKSARNDPDFKDFYVWLPPKYDADRKRIPPNNWISQFAGPAWEWSEQTREYYLHKFAKGQPDLNYRNPNVLSNMTEVLTFWLDRGVDGFRIDVPAHLYENARFPDAPRIPGTTGDSYDDFNHTYEINQPETLKVLKYWADLIYDRVQQDKRDRVVLLEVYDKTPIAMKYYGTGKESLMFPFNFHLLDKVNQSTRPVRYKELIDDWMIHMPEGGVSSWTVGNHDSIRAADRYGPEMVDAINLMTGVLPGMKVAYNGEEIGMRDTFIQWEQTVDPAGRNLGPQKYQESSRDPERTPMQWDNSTSAGFSTNKKTWLPVNPNYWWLNVEAQRKANISHLKVFQAMIEARKDPVLRKGSYNVVVHDNDTLIIIRSYNDSQFALVINIGSEIITYSSKDTFSPYNLDVDMSVVTASINSGYRTGQHLKKGSLSVTLRPKAAVLLKTGLWPPSPSGAPPLLAVSAMVIIVLLRQLL